MPSESTWRACPGPQEQRPWGQRLQLPDNITARTREIITETDIYAGGVCFP